MGAPFYLAMLLGGRPERASTQARFSGGMKSPGQLKGRVPGTLRPCGSLLLCSSCCSLWPRPVPGLGVGMTSPSWGPSLTRIWRMSLFLHHCS